MHQQRRQGRWFGSFHLPVAAEGVKLWPGADPSLRHAVVSAVAGAAVLPAVMHAMPQATEREAWDMSLAAVTRDMSETGLRADHAVSTPPAPSRGR